MASKRTLKIGQNNSVLEILKKVSEVSMDCFQLAVYVKIF